MSPEKYVYGFDLPAIVPNRKSANEVKASFPATLELLGYCPVSLFDGPPGYEKDKLDVRLSLVTHE
jgi:hypothetical protein